MIDSISFKAGSYDLYVIICSCVPTLSGYGLHDSLVIVSLYCVESDDLDENVEGQTL